jgi:hypothetical protein
MSRQQTDSPPPPTIRTLDQLIICLRKHEQTDNSPQPKSQRPGSERREEKLHQLL